MTFRSVWNGIIIPTVTQSIIFQRGRYTTNQRFWDTKHSLAIFLGSARSFDDELSRGRFLAPFVDDVCHCYRTRGQWVNW